MEYTLGIQYQSRRGGGTGRRRGLKRLKGKKHKVLKDMVNSVFFFIYQHDRILTCTATQEHFLTFDAICCSRNGSS